MTGLLSAKGLTVILGGHTALRNVDFVISKGEIVAVVGPNGSGKTTLIRALVGAVPPSSGTIVKDANLRIGYVPQRLTIDPTLPMTVGRFLNLPTRRSKSEVQDALENAGVGEFLNGR
jgi:zinc transport system ATP-binding protein